MRRLHKSFVTLSLLVALCAFAASASAQQGVSKERFINGRITRIDIGARTLTVLDASTRREIRVRIPDGIRFKTSHHAYTRVGFEQLLPGMVVRDLSVS
jgi:hypothetical protein